MASDTEKMFTRLEGKLSRIEALLEEDHKALRGNGQPGLIERVTRLEQRTAAAVWGIRAFCGVMGFVGGKLLDVIARRLAG